MTDGASSLVDAMDHDRAGREAEAIPEYEEAVRLGLPEEDLRNALLGLGSSLRNLERHEEAVRTLGDACARFPDDAALRAFHAFALWSAGRAGDAARELVDALARTRALGGYERVIREYAAEL